MAVSDARASRSSPRPPLGGFLPLGLCFALLFALGFLPPDTALRRVDEVGRISVCVPVDYPPLVLAEGPLPGFDVELLRAVAERSGWRLNLVRNPAMGRDFNPRTWRVTRAQCQMLAGGIAISPTTRSFLDTSRGHLRTGWVMVSAAPGAGIAAGRRVGFYPGLGGLDRVSLGRHLRAEGAAVSLMRSAPALRDALLAGEVEVAITEALVADQMFDTAALELAWLPEELGGRHPVGLGFWRGDSTLRRHVEAILADLAREGLLEEMAARYGLSEAVSCWDGRDC